MYPVIDKKETGINMRRLMDRHQLTAKDMQRMLGLGSVQSVYHWLNGISLPTIDNLYAISEILQLPMDDLVCGNRKLMRSNVMLARMDKNTRRLYRYYDAYRRSLAG